MHAQLLACLWQTSRPWVQNACILVWESVGFEDVGEVFVHQSLDVWQLGRQADVLTACAA